jgi:hypothetical protein
MELDGQKFLRFAPDGWMQWVDTWVGTRLEHVAPHGEIPLEAAYQEHRSTKKLWHRGIGGLVLDSGGGFVCVAASPEAAKLIVEAVNRV